jgi:hypothetical protein
VKTKPQRRQERREGVGVGWGGVNLSQFRSTIGSRTFDRCLFLQIESIATTADLTIGPHAPKIHDHWLHIIRQQDWRAERREMRGEEGKRVGKSDYCEASYRNESNCFHEWIPELYKSPSRSFGARSDSER